MHCQSNIINNVHDCLVILMLDRSGTVLTRTWALYELWQASLSGRPDKLVVLPTSWAWQDMMYPYVAMDFARSECRKEADRALLLREIQKFNDSSAPIEKMKDALITGAKREMFRSEILVVGGSPMKVLHAATAYALMLYLDSRFTDAEDILMGVLPKMEKTRGFNRHVETELMFQLSFVARDKGTSSRTEAYLQSCLRDGRAEDVGEELYYEAMLMYVRHLFEHQEFTKAELLCQKMIDMADDDSRMPVNLLQRFRARTRIQLASLSVAQRLAKDAQERIKEALNIGIQLETADGLIAASCYKILSECARLSPVEHGREEDLMRRSMSIHSRILGENHPETLDLKCYEAQVLAEEHKLAQAEALFQDVYRVRQQLLGSNHVSTIQALINIADLQRQQRKYKEAEASEDRLLTVSSVLLKHCRADVLQNFSLVVTFMETREHLLKKASPFITRAFIVFKEKFGREAEATKNTQKVLEEILAKERQQAADALGEAELNGSMEKYQTAEVFSGSLSLLPSSCSQMRTMCLLFKAGPTPYMMMQKTS
ncbi:hypothetical protein CEUSTIGMA_g4374.t1 [Chlamydomonas eustigma]|uniref:MalT-like TPR region domain-containing protein n=1 Tax=Chlamydomonas eustigma TaxID=1157962 RepID=A0A250X1H2_9CHLO|nr:hypothetical protein CEUSTIGMA_g4374.t1 [Chlamydomonas eustigma]|eukprot:GAX76927.1 hypothetical protein CEUSTIGMA_g4374.t1 [Chlamydomonas eustigma]